MNRPQWAFRLTFLIIVALVMGVIWLLLRQLGVPVSLAPEALAEWLNHQGMFGPVLLMLLMILAVVVGPIPTLPISAASGLVYGVFSGTAICRVGCPRRIYCCFFIWREYWGVRRFGANWAITRYFQLPVPSVFCSWR